MCIRDSLYRRHPRHDSVSDFHSLLPLYYALWASKVQTVRRERLGRFPGRQDRRTNRQRGIGEDGTLYAGNRACDEHQRLSLIHIYYKEVCLLEQPFIKDDELTVAKYVENVAKELGGSLVLTKFVRFEKGEGLEKREDNFADEVASMMK